ncbi:protein FAM234B [Sorex araneus]|uniref:protein FAM234B n=1 Tax=Sorex araneus TaxID=42254 RepID=UPI002433902D|nr:protein FAM234B [Sorex araneus]
MATVLSRALKLPGKKSPDLGEYDPLTQADSDESEDDLVLNVPQKNGGLKNGKSPLGDAPEPDSDAEAAGPAKPHPAEPPPEGFPAENLGELEQKAASSFVAYVRTSVFLLTVLVSMVLVLVCAFLIPCPPRDLHSTWSRRLGAQRGGDLSPLELADVNGDGLRDVLLSFVTARNGSAGVPLGIPRPPAVLVCLSGVNGSTLWSSLLPEEARDITCSDPGPGSTTAATCLVTGTHKLLSVFNATSGKPIWTLNPKHLANGTLAAPAAVLPDVDEDGVRDLLLVATGDSQPDLCFLLVSGRTGSPVGRPVNYNIMGVGNLIGPQVHVTSNGAVYVLFGFGSIQAVALRDIFVQAQNRDSAPASLQVEEPEWEKKRRSVNLSDLIDVCSDGVELLQMVKAPDSNGSDLLITTRQGLTLLHGQNLTPHWTLQLQGLFSQPTPGYFTDDQTLDFLLQVQDGPGMKKMLVVDGDSGSEVWNASVPCHLRECPTTSAVTSDRKSVFLFWAQALPAAGTPPTAEPPALYHLYLLHPTFPSILLDLANATGTVTASKVGINDLWKDAFYVTRSTGPHAEARPAALLVSKLSLRWALMEAQAVALREAGPRVGRGELRRFLSRIKFVDSPYQV